MFFPPNRTASNSSSNLITKIPHLNWLDALKAFALMAIMLNHLVEEFGSGPWFTNPSNNWPDFATRIRNIFPQDYNSPIISFFQFIGWLGDSGPGVFILVSGISLTWAALHRPPEEMKIFEFYRRRLIRIFPIYITMHFIIFAGSLFIPNNKLSLANPKTLLSMLGLRFTDSLFFYISPSWWFVWLIIQLYIIFPFLLRILSRIGIRWFLVLTFGLTFATRFYGILYSNSLYYWMTGIFFGTRLAEFSAGMAIAALLFRSEKQGYRMLGMMRLFALSFQTYILGLLCSFTLNGSIVSNLLVTLGMSGLFYTVWQGFVRKVPVLMNCMVWIGIESYAVYLLHQPPLKWSAVLGNIKLHFAAALLVLIVSFPFGWLINRIVTKMMQIGKQLLVTKSHKLFSMVLALGTGLALIFVEPKLWSYWKYELFSLVLGLTMVYLGFVEYYSSIKENWSKCLLRRTIISASFLQLFIFPRRFGIVTLSLGCVIGLLSVIAQRYFKTRVLAWSVALSTAVFIIAILELTLNYHAPLETDRWGELPALQVHPTRIYSLKPNQETHLKYNNYNYVLKTNSFGLASPEIEAERPTSDTFRILIIGDAFSMPEGVEYEYSYPALLERHLSGLLKHRNVQVINAGVTGYGPVEQYPQLIELAPLFKPDIVIYEFFINEFHEVLITPEERLKNIGLISSNDSIRVRMLKRSQIITRYQRMYERVKEIFTKRPAYWRYEKSLLQYYRTGENDLYSQERISKVGFYLESMSKACQGIGAKLVIYFVPASVAVSKPSYIAYFPWDQDLSDRARYDLDRPLRSLRMIADPLKIPVVDLTPYLRNHAKQPIYFPESWHWNREGHRVVAKVISDTLTKLGYLPLMASP